MSARVFLFFSPLARMKQQHSQVDPEEWMISEITTKQFNFCWVPLPWLATMVFAVAYHPVTEEPHFS
jgi:hypothetical protein